jgi:hypothetical protein
MIIRRPDKNPALYKIQYPMKNSTHKSKGCSIYFIGGIFFQFAAQTGIFK